MQKEPKKYLKGKTFLVIITIKELIENLYKRVKKTKKYLQYANRES